MRYSLAIRFTNSVGTTRQLKDLEIPLSINFDKDDVNSLVNVKWIKSIIRNKESSCANKRLRLIYNGSILNEHTDFMKTIFEPKLKQSSNDTQTVEKIYIHCVIGDELSPEQMTMENQLDNRAQEVSTNPEVTGFDRLLQQGFTQEDITDLRRQFYLIYSPDLSNNSSNRNDQINDLEEEERNQRMLRQLEERWINSTVRNNPDEVTATEQNNLQAPLQAQDDIDLQEGPGSEDLLISLLIGVFLGALSLLLLVADDTVFNKRQKMTIFMGVVLNFIFSLVRI